MAGVFTLFLKDYVEEGNFIRDELKLKIQVQSALVRDELEPTLTMQNSFMLTAGDG